MSDLEGAGVPQDAGVRGPSNAQGQEEMGNLGRGDGWGFVDVLILALFVGKTRPGPVCDQPKIVETS